VARIPGQDLIKQDIREHNREHGSWYGLLLGRHLHEHTFRTAVAKGGLNEFLFQMVNIREQDSWVHLDKPAATVKAWTWCARRFAAWRCISRSVKGTFPSTPMSWWSAAASPVIHAALTLANAGKKVYLVEREPSIGGHMAKFDKTFPTVSIAPPAS